MVDDVYFSLPYFEPHALFRAYMLRHPDADIVWITAPDGTSDASMDDRTVRGFRRWHQALQEGPNPTSLLPGAISLAQTLLRAFS